MYCLLKYIFFYSMVGDLQLVFTVYIFFFLNLFYPNILSKILHFPSHNELQNYRNALRL